MTYDLFPFPLSEPEVFVFTLVRVILGTLFFFQAYDKIFRIGLNNEYLEVSRGSLEKGVPLLFSKMSVYATSIIEITAGLLLILGLFTPIVLYALGIHLALVVLAFSFLGGIWDLKHVFPRLALLIFLLVLPLSWNLLSIDYLLGFI
jgi:uncharacterized membrane protein YphA (DoxX/SURF4 family)